MVWQDHYQVSQAIICNFVSCVWFTDSCFAAHSSSVKLAYSDAQEVIEGRPLPANRLEGKEDERDEVEKSINMLAVSSSLPLTWSRDHSADKALWRQ